MSDDWVYVGEDVKDDETVYYNSITIVIDYYDKIIKVWVKRSFTDRRRYKWLKKCFSIINPKYNENGYNLLFIVFNYKEWKYNIKSFQLHSESDTGLNDIVLPFTDISVRLSQGKG